MKESIGNNCFKPPLTPTTKELAVRDWVMLHCKSIQDRLTMIGSIRDEFCASFRTSNS